MERSPLDKENTNCDILFSYDFAIEKKLQPVDQLNLVIPLDFLELEEEELHGTADGI